MTKWELQLPPSREPEQIFFERGESGVVYCRRGEINAALPRHAWRGQAWKFHRSITSYRPDQSIRYKSLASLKPESEEDFWHIMNSCRNANITPPSSFADIFFKVCPTPRPLLSETFLLKRESYGGWQENVVKGVCRGRIYHYDIRSAYRWAACQGLPDPRSVYPVRRPDDSWFVFYGTVKNPPLYATEKPQLWTREEVEQCRLEIDQFRIGYGYERFLDLTPAFQQIECRFPYCFKRISRAFWGRWNTRQSVEQVSWVDGKPKITRRANFIFNPVWARVITSRVKLRIQKIMVDAQTVHIFVDSILCYEQVPTGEAVGDWVLKGEYDGVRVWGPGIWGIGDKLVKHCGMTERQALTFRSDFT